jgi:hypothetical protein
MSGSVHGASALGSTGLPGPRRADGPSPRAGGPRFSVVGAFAAEVVAALTVCAVAFDAPHSWRVVLAVALFFWAPGHCLAVLADISDGLLFGVVAVATSIGLCLLASLALFYLAAWHGSTALVVIAVVTVVLAALALLRERAL